MGRPIDFAIENLKTGRWPFLGGIEFSKKVYGLNRSSLDVLTSPT